MSSGFYNQGQSSNGGGFYNSGGGYGQSQFGQQQSQSGSYSGNVSQWQTPTPQPGMSSNNNNNTRQQAPSQQQQSTPAFWTPDTNTMTNAATNIVGGVMAEAAKGGMTNEAILGAVFKQGQGFVGQTGGFVPGLNKAMLTLRTYFAVDNRYVKRKMQKVLFPFLSKQWRRMQVEGPDEVNYALPHSDENAPDLYLPVMSLITYCLLSASCYGTAGEFSPEVIADVTTKCFITQILEVCVIYFGFYMMQAPVAVLDLFSYTGYKYLGLTLNMLFGLGLGHLGYGTTGFYVTLLWTASAAAFFMLKTMAHNIPVETASTGPKRELMVMGFAGLQAASMWFVSQTKFL